MRARDPAPKKTVDVTDDTVNTVTEYFRTDRQDVHVNVVKPVVSRIPRKEQ